MGVGWEGGFRGQGGGGADQDEGKAGVSGQR